MAQKVHLSIAFKFIRVRIRWAIETTSAGTALVGKPERGGPVQELDGWQCRQEFLGLPEDDHALCQFLNKVGLWTSVPSLYEGAEYTKHVLGAPPILLSETIRLWPFQVWTLRKVLTEQLKSRKSFISLYASPGYNRPQSGLIPDLSLRFKLDGQVSMGVVTTTSFWETLLATIYVDIARGFHFATCQRRDCDGDPLFVVESRHKRKYCSQYCGHIESVRRQRRLQKRAEGAKKG
jgi:hypothetical protein